MSKIVPLDKHKKKFELSKIKNHFARQLKIFIDICKQGNYDKIVIIGTMKNETKFITGNVYVSEAKEMCRDFISNTEEYLD